MRLITRRAAARSIRCLAAVAALGTAMLAGAAWPVRSVHASNPGPDPAGATSFLGNPAHTNSWAAGAQGAPLARRWSLTGSVGGTGATYALADHDRVFTLIDHKLFALRAADGSELWPPVTIEAIKDRENTLAYDSGIVAVKTMTGKLIGFDAATGGQLWSDTVGQPRGTSTPPNINAAGGLFILPGGPDDFHTIAVRASDGTTAWTIAQPIGWIAIDGSTIYTADHCSNAWAFDLATGHTVWSVTGNCVDGTTDFPPMVAGGRLFIPDAATSRKGKMLDEAGGQTVGGDYSIANEQSPAVDGSILVTQLPSSQGPIGYQATDIPSGNVLWTWPETPGYDTSAPFIVGHTVYLVDTHGWLVALDETTGAVIWTDQSLPQDGNNENATDQIPYAIESLSAGDGLLLVPTRGGLAAYSLAQGGSASPPLGCASSGYWLVASDGGIFPFGSAGGYGSTGGMRLNRPVVGMARTPTGRGYWLVASDGGVFPFGDARGFGSTGNIRLNQPIVGMAATPDGAGYWLIASDGGIFPFGDAGGYGSTGAIRLNRPMVGMTATPSGHGYWLVASDGGIFPFGDAAGLGSTGGIHLNQPVVGMAATTTGGGYWLVASDGGIFPFGDAPGLGSTGGMHLNRPVVGMAATRDGRGYLLVTSDGGIFPFGDAPGCGSTGNVRLSQPMVGATAT